MAVVIIYEDDSGWSFVIVDGKHRSIFNDIVEERFIFRIYEKFSVTLTITNSDFKAPVGFTKVVDPVHISDEFLVHTPFRARQFANIYLTAVCTVVDKPVRNIPSDVKPLRFEDETWILFLS